MGMMEDKNALQLLCEAVESKVGRKIQTPKDFEFLAERIFEQLHERISASTLKRIWGYVPQTTIPRTSTLDLLSQFVGNSDWQDFCHQLAPQPPLTPHPSGATDSSAIKDSTTRQPSPRWLFFLLTALIVAIAAVFLFKMCRSDEQPSYIIHKGQQFASIEEYLQLFGIEKAKDPWGVPLPGHELILVWGPQYQHPNWHNTGNVDSLMPTITEWWSAPDSLPEVVARYNRDRYDFLRRMGEVRITFMKNLVDTNYVFLGVYRMSHIQSDSSKIVWERVFDQCDLTRIADIETLRNPSTLFTGR